jgi:hypothetical protein
MGHDGVQLKWKLARPHVSLGGQDVNVQAASRQTVAEMKSVFGFSDLHRRKCG